MLCLCWSVWHVYDRMPHQAHKGKVGGPGSSVCKERRGAEGIQRQRGKGGLLLELNCCFMMAGDFVCFVLLGAH